MTGKKDANDEPHDPRHDQRHLSLLIALMAVVIVSAVTAIAADMVFGNQAIRQLGFSVAILGGIAYFGLRIYGNLKAREYLREMRRRELARSFADDRHADDDDDDHDAYEDDEGDRRRDREPRA